MGIELWSTTAASNNSASPAGAPEGMAPSGVNDTIRQNMASVRSWFETPQWINLGYTHTYASGTSFTIATTDYTSTYHAGRRIKAVGSSTGTIYGTITSSSYSSSTTVNISWDSGSLSNETLTISISALTKTNDAIPYLNKRSADVASASTIDLNAVRGESIDVTGTTTITAITLAEGQSREVRFTGALTLTHGASLILPTSANITTVAGDYAIFRGYASSIVRCVGYFRNDGKALTALTTGTDLALTGKFSTTAAGTLTIATGAVTATGSNHLLDTEGAAASDDLDTISGGVDGMRLVIGSVADARDVVIKHNTGNIWNPNGLNITLGVTTDKVELIYSSTLSKWIVIAFPSSSTTTTFESSQQTITLAGSLTLAHGLSAQPKKYQAFLKCTTGEHGYSIGDETTVRESDRNDNGPGYGVAIIPDSTNLNVRYGDTALVILNKTTGAAANITTGNWKTIFRASIYF